MKMVHPESLAELSEEEIRDMLADVPKWRRERRADGADTITRTFKFPSEVALTGFFSRMMKTSQNFEHHADMDIRYLSVCICLTTNSAGGKLTLRDFLWAISADKSAADLGGK